MKPKTVHLKSLISCILGILSVFFAVNCFGATIYVPADQPTIQAGIDAADHGDTVIVADGTYTGDGNKNLVFNGKAITVRSENGPDNCIIDGEYSTSMPARGFYFYSGEDNSSVVSGFTITRFYCRGIYIENSSPTISNCIFSDNGADECDKPGAAIFNSGAFTTVTNCSFFRNHPLGFGYQGGGAIRNNGGLTVTGSTFMENYASSGGGAIRNTGTLNVSNCAFTNNGATWHKSDGFGGGAICNTGSLAVTNSTFSDNSGDAYVGGGAISNYSNTSSPAFATITNCAFDNNDNYQGITWGGAIYNRNSSMIIVNCIFSGNKSRFGGAIYAKDANTSTIITNCTFTGNFARREDDEEISGGAIDASNATITNCIFWANKSFDGIQIVADDSTTVKYSDIEGGFTGEGNIEDDPLFIDLGYWDDNGTPLDYRDDFFVNGDYHLRKNSPCIDAGTAENAPDADIDGDTRPQGVGYDMGAYEYVQNDDGGGGGST